MPEEMTGTPSASEGSVEVSSAESTSTDTATTTESTTTETAKTSTEPKGDVQVVVKDNGERTMQFENAKAILGLEQQEAPQEQAQPENAVAPEPPAPPAPEPYQNMEEIFVADTNGTLDWSRVTPEQQAMINNYQQAVQQRQQAEAARQQQIRDAETAMQKRQADMIANIGIQARELAMQQLGITEQDLNNAQYDVDGENKRATFQQTVDNISASLITKAIESQVIERQNFQSWQQSMGQIKAFGESEMAKEPLFKEIDQLATTRKHKLPYEQAVAVFKAEQDIANGICGPQQLAVLTGYWNECKKEVYAKHNNVSKIPTRTSTPKVEGAGLPHNDVSKGIDISKTSNMSQRDRDAVFTQMFKQQLFGK